MATSSKTPGLGKALLLMVAASAARAFRSEERGDAPHARSREHVAEAQPKPPQGWWPTLKRVYEEIDKDRVLAVAAGVTFYGLLALFPAVTAFVSIFGLFADPQQVVERLNQMQGMLPEGAVSIIRDQILRIITSSEGSLSFAFISGLAFALWSANAGMKAIMDALNVAYGRTEQRSFIKLNAMSLGFTLGALLFLALFIAVIAVVPAVLAYLNIGPLAEFLIWAGRWPVVFAVVILGIALLYYLGPSREQGDTCRWITPGSIIAGVGLVAFSMLFSWYAASFGNYNATYGTLGAAIGFMTWLWLSTTIVLVGAEFNTVLDEQREGSRRV